MKGVPGSIVVSLTKHKKGDLRLSDYNTVCRMGQGAAVLLRSGEISHETTHFEATDDYPRITVVLFIHNRAVELYVSNFLVTSK